MPYLNNDVISAIVKPMADGIAAELGEGWRVEPLHTASEFPDIWTLRHGPSTAKLNLEMSNHDQAKLTISASVPNRDYTNAWWVGCGLSINVSTSRGPATIAAEIRRRLMPEYLPMLETAHQQCAAAADYSNRRRAVLLEFMGILGVSDHQRKRTNVETFNLYKGPGYGEVQVSPDSVTLHLRSMPVELARQIANVYAFWKANATQEAS